MDLFLEYSDIYCEIKGSMVPGKIKMTNNAIVFKNNKTGKIEQLPASDMEMVNFQNFAGTWGIRIFSKNGILHRYVNFKDGDKEKVAKFFTNTYKKDMLEKELSLKGWNWGTAKFNGSVLSFDIGSNSAFEIPLNHVSQCNTGKNEVTLEFHQNDDDPVSLMEMRFFIPSNELAGDLDPVDAFQQQVMTKASVISVSGDAIAIFREMHCLTPRGRYDIKIFSTFFQLHGKTFDYKIPMSTVLRLFILPHKDSRQQFFVVSLDPPIKQGQTRYHFLVLLFQTEEETTIELPFTEEELKDKFEGKLEKEISGPTHEVLGKVMKVIINRKISTPGNFVGNTGTPAISCSFKAAAGYVYPLERGFIYIHKPPIHIRFEEIASVNFARGGGNTRSFDFEVELKSGVNHTFSNIEKEEYGKLFDFVMSKKLNIKNRGKNDKANYKDDFGDSDDEKEPDAYLARVKAEAQERYDDENVSGEESTDEDFNPDQAESDVAEEYDSNHNESSSDGEEDAAGSGGDGDTKKKEKKHKKEKKERKARPASDAPTRTRKTAKKDRDVNCPKRPSTAFMIWLNATRETIKAEKPGISVTEIAKRGGELWRELKDKSEWDKKASKAKEEYHAAMKIYEDSGAAAAYEESNKSKAAAGAATKPTTAAAKKKAPVASVSPAKAGLFKSKEYIESDGSSDDEASADKKKRKEPKRKTSVDSTKSPPKKTKKSKSASESDGESENPTPTKEKKKQQSASDASDEEEAESTPASGDDSD